MAKKNSKRNRKSNKKRAGQSSPEINLPPMMAKEQMMREISKMLQGQDFESEEEMNQFLKEQLLGGDSTFLDDAFDVMSESDVEHAQQLIYEAHEAKSKSKALKLVREALTISPDCADGYTLLADWDAKTLAEAWALYEAGMHAAERVLGDEFEELKGSFWGFMETRPYMRARFGLALTLWKLGRFREAADHMAAMLELNPNDNQGVRQVY